MMPERKELTILESGDPFSYCWFPNMKQKYCPSLHQGRSNMYTQKRKSIHIWTKNMEKIYRTSDGFLILHVQNVCI